MAIKAIKYIQDKKGVNANDAYKLLFNSKWDPIEAAAASSTQGETKKDTPVHENTWQVPLMKDATINNN